MRKSGARYPLKKYAPPLMSNMYGNKRHTLASIEQYCINVPVYVLYVGRRYVHTYLGLQYGTYPPLSVKNPENDPFEIVPYFLALERHQYTLARGINI
jgi:hypothetical protein